MSEIKVGDWTLTAMQRGDLAACHGNGNWLREKMNEQSRQCCEILGIDPTTDSVAKDIAEEIVLHGTPVDEAIAKLQKHLEATR